MSDDVRAVPDDPSQAQVRRQLAMAHLTNGEPWLVAGEGAYDSYAIQARTKGKPGEWNDLVALEWPARRMGTDDQVRLRILLHPEDAAGLADSLAHTAAWLRARAELQPPPGRGKSKR